MPAVSESKYVVQCSWEEVPHLTEQARAQLLASIPPYQRDARTRGIPSLGSGAIYPVPESEIVVPDQEIPTHWPRAYGLDIGWNRTAAVWGAQDRETGTIYLYSEYYRGEAEPVIHAAAVQSRGEWIPGVIDPAARGRGQRDGQQLLQDYRNLGLNIIPATNALEAGILEVWQLLSLGKLKVFRSLSNWLREFRYYRRNEKGKIHQPDARSNQPQDHLMDATRYLILSGRQRMQIKPVKLPPSRPLSRPSPWS